MGRLFYRKCLRVPEDMELIKKIISLDPEEMFSPLKNYLDKENSILPVYYTEIIMYLCSSYSEFTLESVGRSGRHYSIVRELPSLVIGLYEQTDDDNIKTKLLDLWDLFYKNNLSDVQGLTKRIIDSF